MQSSPRVRHPSLPSRPSLGSFGNGTLTQSSKVYAGNGYLVGVCGPRDPYLSMLYDFNLPEDTVPHGSTSGGLSY